MTRPAVRYRSHPQLLPPPQRRARARRAQSCPASNGALSSNTPDATSGTSQVRIVEVGPRDGLQNEPGTIGLATKLRLLAALGVAGLRHIEAGAFVSPRWVPQMADSPTILRLIAAARTSVSAGTGAGGSAQAAETATAIDTSTATASGEGEDEDQEEEDITYSWLVPNERGFAAMLSALVQSQLPTPASVLGHEIAILASASEGFSRRNLNCSVAESLARSERVAARARGLGLRVRGYVSVVVDCPDDGPTPPAAVGYVAQRLLAMGCYEVSLGDTTGKGTTASVTALLHHLTVDRAIPARRLAAHLHDTFGMAISNARVALDFGIRTFDASVAGLGGCPYAVDSTGNVATEDLVYFLEGCGLRTGVDLDALIDVGQWISHALGRRNASRVGGAMASLSRGA